MVRNRYALTTLLLHQDWKKKIRTRCVIYYDMYLSFGIKLISYVHADEDAMNTYFAKKKNHVSIGICLKRLS